jgi:hypothetical protein
LLCAASPEAHAQQTVTIQRENALFLAEPGGVRLGRFPIGTRVAATGSRSAHTQIQLDGWIWSESVRPEVRDGHTLSVRRTGEENVRNEPNGTIVARLIGGVLLDSAGRRGGWVHVRRSGWVASADLQAAGATAAAPARAAAPAPVPAVAAPPVARPVPAVPETTVVENLDPRLAIVRRRVDLRRAPGATPAGTLEAEMPVRITARAGEWVRVEAQGWVREQELRPAGSSALNNVTAAELRTDPERFRGRLLRWTIQFIALQTADDLRPDFQPGERYILARGPAPEYAFAYIVVPAAKVAEVTRLQSLSSVTIIARVRSGRSAFLANPVLELVEIVP